MAFNVCQLEVVGLDNGLVQGYLNGVVIEVVGRYCFVLDNVDVVK